MSISISGDDGREEQNRHNNRFHHFSCFFEASNIYFYTVCIIIINSKTFENSFGTLRNASTQQSHHTVCSSKIVADRFLFMLRLVSNPSRFL